MSGRVRVRVGERKREIDSNRIKDTLATFQVIVVSCLYCSVDPKRECGTYILPCISAYMECKDKDKRA